MTKRPIRAAMVDGAVFGLTVGVGLVAANAIAAIVIRDNAVRAADRVADRVATRLVELIRDDERGDRTSEALAGGASSHAGRLCADGAGLDSKPLFAPRVTDPASAVFVPVAHPPRPPP